MESRIFDQIQMLIANYKVAPTQKQSSLIKDFQTGEQANCQARWEAKVTRYSQELAKCVF